VKSATDIVNRIIELKEKIKEVESLRCTCDSFSLQYNQGCQCEAGRKKRYAKYDLENFIGGVGE